MEQGFETSIGNLQRVAATLSQESWPWTTSLQPVPASLWPPCLQRGGWSECHSHSLCVTRAVFGVLQRQWAQRASDPGSWGFCRNLQLGCGNPPRCAQVPLPDWLVGEKRGGCGWSRPQNWLPLGYRALKVLGTLPLHSSSQRVFGQHSPL